MEKESRTLPSSGSISASQVNVELKKTSNAAMGLNDSDVRKLAGKTSGTISYSDLRGKSGEIIEVIARIIKDGVRVYPAQNGVGARCKFQFKTSRSTLELTEEAFDDYSLPKDQQREEMYIRLISGEIPKKVFVLSNSWYLDVKLNGMKYISNNWELIPNGSVGKWLGYTMIWGNEIEYDIKVVY
ncbi:MAG: hypothetical protein ACRCZ9_02475 [Fusobacteriaceae bacterium]